MIPFFNDCLKLKTFKSLVFCSTLKRFFENPFFLLAVYVQPHANLYRYYFLFHCPGVFIDVPRQIRYKVRSFLAIPIYTINRPDYLSVDMKCVLFALKIINIFGWFL